MQTLRPIETATPAPDSMQERLLLLSSSPVSPDIAREMKRERDGGKEREGSEGKEMLEGLRVIEKNME
jgi:hypothetical protein